MSVRRELVRFRRRVALGATVLAVLAAAAGCSDPPPAAPAAMTDVVRVGSANFGENRLLAEIYATGLERRGVPVERRFSVGNRENYLPALQDGSIDLVPEYTGNLLLFLDPDTTAATPDQVLDQLTDQLPAQVRLLNRAEAQDKDTVTVTRAYAAQNKLQSIADLAPLCSSIVFGGPPEFEQRPYGTPGLSDNYDCDFSGFRPLDAGGPQTVAALREGKVQAADLFTSDPAIPDNDFVVLQDLELNFPAQNVVPLINAAKSNDPRVSNVLNQISAKLDTTTLTNLNRSVASDQDPTAVARQWLTSIGI